MSPTLTKRELARTIAARVGVTEKRAIRLITEAIWEVVAHLSTPGHRVELRGLGSLRSCVVPARMARNPRQPRAVFPVGPRLRVRFTQSHTFGAAMPCPSGGADKPGQ